MIRGRSIRWLLPLVLFWAGPGEALAVHKRLIAPSSSLTPARAEAMVSAWVRLDPSRHSYVSPLGTGSMRPLFDANCILLLERVDSWPASVGDIAIRTGNPGPVHRVEATRPDGSLMYHAISVYGTWRDTPDRNDRGGWWFPADSVAWRVAAIVYIRRAP